MPLERGKEIFDDLVEFPPPPEPHTSDYIFYFVDADDHGFGEAAHAFFGKYYKPKGYVEKRVHSLEELIGVLFADVNAGVTRIREIVIVAHATPQGLQPPVFASASATNLPAYRHITEKTLSYLQRDFKIQKFGTFHDQRAAVVAKLFSDSCVTIRACRVGSSLACMYAYYAFFGGRANVYAPKEYMFFGHQFLLPGSRIENREQLHEHLVKQHFVKKDRTPDRKEALVRAFLDPALFASPAQLAEKLSSTSSDDAADYDALVKDLDAQRASDLLGAKFAAAGQHWESKPAIRVGVKAHRWRVTGTLTSPGGTFGVDYFVDQQTVPDGVALMSSARVRVTRGAEEFPFQLFMQQEDDDQFTGKVIGEANKPFRLAAYAANSDPGKTTFDAIVKLLTNNHYSNGSIDLAAMFKSTLDVDLAQPPHIVSLTPNLSVVPDARLIWSIGGTPSYLVKQEIAVASDASQTHTLTVYLDKESTARRQEDVKSRFGSDPDAPGTELANYLDQYSLDDLADFIDYLNTPYRTENSYYIRHAQNAINRKRGSEKWERDRMGPEFTSVAVPRFPYTNQYGIESDDLKSIAYSFDFNAVWQEVKQSFPVAPAFQSDLYEEDPLWERISESALPDPSSLPNIESESPSQDLDTLRQLESQGLDPFFVESKEVIELPKPAQPECDEFRRVVQKWKDLQGQSPQAMLEQLSELSPEGKKTYLSYLWEAFEWYERISGPLDLLEVMAVGKGIPSLIVEHVLGFEAESLLGIIAGPVSAAVLPGALMWLGFAHAQVEAGEAWKKKGTLVAVRQWLLGLELLAHHGLVPDEPHIDLGDFHAAYASELGVDVNSAIAFVYFPEEFKDGFDEGKEAMERAARTIVARADEASTKVLRSLNFLPCQIQILKDAGVFDVAAIRSAVIEALARLTREHMRRP